MYLIEIRSWLRINPSLLKFGIDQQDDEETQLHKSILIHTSLLIIIPAIIWGIIYLSYNELIAGLIPILYAILSAASLFILKLTFGKDVFL